MLARVVAIESGDMYTDGHRRVLLKFDAGDTMFNKIRFDEHALGIVGLQLDDQIEVLLVPVRETATVDEASPAAGG